jgi:hypothetical protein
MRKAVGFMDKHPELPRRDLHQFYISFSERSQGTRLAFDQGHLAEQAGRRNGLYRPLGRI